MVCIVDSGSTKTDWRLVSPTQTICFVSRGINPSLLTEHTITCQLSEDLPPNVGKDVSALYFYGAGCTNVVTQQKIYNALTVFFPDANIGIDNDLIGAAKACCGDESGIVAILGTGANSGVFDGQKIVHQIPPLGYILGDEGSGAYLGKQLLRAWFYNEMPKHLQSSFAQYMPYSRTEVIEKVYRQNSPNKFLAQLTHFLSRHRDDTFCNNILQQAFSSFCKRHLLKYDSNLPVHFVGSIAKVFEQELVQVLSNHELRTGNILDKPIEQLVNYHLNSSAV